MFYIKSPQNFLKLKEPLSSGTHAIGALIALIGTVALAIEASGNGNSLIGALIFGVALTLLLAISSLLHGLNCNAKWVDILERLDYAAIYIFIAATYTPLCLKVLNGSLSTWFLASQWALALTGVFLIFRRGSFEKRSQVIIFLLLGWSFLIAARTIYVSLNQELLTWLVAGGLFYSIGTLFFLGYKLAKTNEAAQFHHGIWHIFVLGGAFSHFVFVAGICC